MTNTKSSKQWDDVVGIDSDNIIDHYDPEIVDCLFKRYEIIKEHCEDINPNVLLILEDIIDDPILRNDDSLISIFTRGRWSRIGIILSTQYLNAVNPLLRNNADIIICTIQKSLQSREILCDAYGGLLVKKNFFKLLNDYTNDYMVFIIRNDKNTNNPELLYQWDKVTKNIKNIDV